MWIFTCKDRPSTYVQPSIQSLSLLKLKLAILVVLLKFTLRNLNDSREKAYQLFHIAMKEGRKECANEQLLKMVNHT